MPELRSKHRYKRHYNNRSREGRKMNKSIGIEELERLEALSASLDQRLEALKGTTAETVVLANELVQLTQTLANIRETIASED
jgi:hypothetical protein